MGGGALVFELEVLFAVGVGSVRRCVVGEARTCSTWRM